MGLGSVPRLSAAGIAAGVVVAVAVGGAAQAQGGQTPPGPTGLGRADIDPARRVPSPEPAPGVVGAVDPQACPFAGQGVPITVTRVIAEGATQIPPAAIDAGVREFLNRPADLAIVCQIRDRVAELYARQGRRLTRVELPEQRIPDGVLRLRVTEGYVASASVERAAAQGPSAQLAEAYLSQLETNRPADWGAVERAILLLREIPGAEVDVRLRPSTAGPGAVEAVASFGPRRKFDVVVGVQHLGSEELGETAALTRIDANSFTRFGERTSLILFSSLGGEQQVVQLLEEFRLGGSGLLVAGDIAYGRTAPQGVLTPLQIEGDALIARIGTRYPAIKTQRVALTVGARFDLINQENQLGVLGGVPGANATLFEEQLRVFAAEADWRWRPTGPAQAFSASGNLELRRGIEGLGSSRAGDDNLSRVEGRPDFTSLRVTLRGRFDFRPGANSGPWAEIRGLSQWADGPLLAFEEYQVGNYTIGRGYDPGAASGDRAVAAQFEAGWMISTTPGGRRLTLDPFVFYDMARLENADTFGFESDIRSAGAGVRARFDNKYELSLMYAIPQTEPFPNAPKPDARWLFTFARAFRFR